REEGVERVPRALAVEDVAGPQREFFGERACEILVDAFELDTADHALVNRNRERARRGVERRGDAREGEVLAAVQIFEAVADLVGGDPPTVPLPGPGVRAGGFPPPAPPSPARPRPPPRPRTARRR